MRFCLLALFAIASMAAPAAAQDQSDDPPSSTSARDRGTPDFLFGRPSGSVAVRGGWVFARAKSDWYTFVTQQLTLNRGNFNTPGIAMDVDIALTDRLSASIGADFGRAKRESEYRNFVEQVNTERRPINQRTELRQANVMGGIKLALQDRGRQISSFAWIPTSVVPYVGAGGGAVWYGLQQQGDFVDFADNNAIFTDAFESKGWAPTAHVMAGVDVRVARRLFATIDARYRWAAAKLNDQWVDFDPIDLSGLRLSAGINVPF